ncbi:deleted in malignant brain tumors 1 protein-like [Haliotis asinina]|uniref:deleted in malignant brain tumors 1 protein-like n=1 Tax=Haliotis asinina TaxID=109174 RepID=UPI003532796F
MMKGYVNLALFLYITTAAVTAQSCDLSLQIDTTSKNQRPVVGGSGTCTWTITSTGSPGPISLDFRNVNLTQHPTCDVSNSIVVYDGDVSGAILGLVCGNYTNNFQSSGNVITVRYPATEVTETDAFELHYVKRDIGSYYGLFVKAVSTAEYNIFSYGYPDGTSETVSSTWYVRTLRDQRVRLSVETAGNASTSCPDVQIKFTNGDGKEEVTWCPGRDSIYQSWGQTTRMDLRISPERSVRVKYRAIEGPTCRDDNLTAAVEEQFLMTPGYPNPFPSYQECRWKIDTANVRKGSIRIDVLEIDLDTQRCSTDSVRVYDETALRKLLVGTACETPASFYVYGHAAVVEFKSLKENNAKTGFKLKYYYTTAAEPCGGNLVANSTRQNVTSPGYPVNYPNSFRCAWTITAENPQGHVVVSFLEGQLYRLFKTDIVTVYDGNSTSGYLMGRVVGDAKPTFSSQESALTLVFSTDDLGQFTLGNNAGFVYGYEETLDTPPMHRFVETKSGTSTMLSPRFPDGEVRDMNATWTVRSDFSNYQVLLSFVEVDAGDTSGCNNNYIMVYRGNTSSNEFSKICGNETGKYVSRDRELTVVFKTDSNLAKRGFKAEYIRPRYGSFDGCQGDVDVKTAVSIDSTDVVSPLYPGIYPNMMNCSTLVKAILNGSFLRLEVTDMDMPHPEDTNCTRDYVEFFDGPSTNDPSLGRACGNSSLKVKSTGGQVLVMFISDANIGGKGYRIKYKSDREITPYSMPVGIIVGITLGVVAFVAIVIVYLVCKYGRETSGYVL